MTKKKKTLKLKTHVHERVTDVKPKGGPTKGGQLAPYKVGDVHLTEKEYKTVKLYTDPNQKRSKSSIGMEVYGHRDLARRALNKPHMQDAIKFLMGQDDITSKIMDGVREIIKDPKNPKFLSAVDMILKVRGSYAPEKKLNVNMTPEQLEAEKQDVIAALRGEGDSHGREIGQRQPTNETNEVVILDSKEEENNEES